MMKLFVKEVAQAKGFKNAKALADAMTSHFGASMSYSTIYPLWKDDAKLWARDTFDKLCAFLNVPAGVLIQHIPGEAQSASPSQTNAGKAARRRAAKV
jgi:DNA-binding Xre family transcriptional regulator